MTPNYDEMVALIKKDHPTFKVKRYDESWWFRFLMLWGWRMGATTMLTTVYMQPEYIGKPTGAHILRHERVHIDDSVKSPFWFFFSYIMLPPFLGPGMRAHWEWRGYCEDLKEMVEVTKRVDLHYIDWIVDEFCNADYLWMYPFKKRMTKRCVDFCECYLAFLKDTDKL